MEDKWRIHMEGDWLHFDRSWTGTRIYRLRFATRGDQQEVVEALINDNRENFRRNADEYEVALVDFLIRRLMLHEDVPFPLPADLEAHEGVFQHSVAGTAYPTKRLGATWWSRTKDALLDLLGTDVTAVARHEAETPPPAEPEQRVPKKAQAPGDDFGLVFELTFDAGSVKDVCFVCGAPSSRPNGTSRVACRSCHTRARLPDTGAFIRDLIKPPKEGDFPLEGSTLSFLFSPVMIDDRRGAIESVAGGWGVHEEVYPCDNLFEFRLRHYEPYASSLGQIRARELRERFETLDLRDFMRTVYFRLPERARHTFDVLGGWYALAIHARRVRERFPLRTNIEVLEAAREVHALLVDSDGPISLTDMFRRIEALQAELAGRR